MKINLYIGAIRKAAAFIKKRAPGFTPDIGFVLGSGLAKAVPPLEKTLTIPYREIPGFPRTTVPGHEGKLILGRSAGRSVVVMQGRFHYYEGHAMEDIALPIRALEYLGLKTLIVTAAVGSMREKVKPGHFTVITDHINLMGRNPLRAFHEEEFGTMFPDMTQAYDAKLKRRSWPPAASARRPCTRACTSPSAARPTRRRPRSRRSARSAATSSACRSCPR